jgi:hypothetical protein
MFRELAESLRKQLEEALTLRVAFSDDVASVEGATTPSTAATRAAPVAPESSLQAASEAGLTLVWLGLKEFVSRRTPSAYDQTAMHVSGKLEYLAVAQRASALENHDAMERLLRACLLHGIDYALVELTDPCWNALGLRPRPALRLLRSLTLDVPVGRSTALVESVHLMGRLTSTTSAASAPSPQANAALRDPPTT